MPAERDALAPIDPIDPIDGGAFNVAEDGAEVSSEKAKRELDWRPSMRLAEAAKR